MQWAKLARAEGRRHKVFTASQADIFDSEAPVSERRRLWCIIRTTSDALDWQILTKRPERIVRVMDEDDLPDDFFLENFCWLGVSVENQQAAEARIPLLLKIPAEVRFLSCEPLLSSVDLRRVHLLFFNQYVFHEAWLDSLSVYSNGLPGISWVICGGESGPDARAMESRWVRSLRDQCQTSAVSFFFKQWGEWLPSMCDGTPGQGQLLNCSDQPARVGKKSAGSLLDGREWKQFPGCVRDEPRI
jgi:protein gp37